MTNLQGRFGAFEVGYRAAIGGGPQGLRMRLIRANPSPVSLHAGEGSSRKAEDYIATFEFTNTPGVVGIRNDHPYIFRLGSTGGVPLYGQNLYLEVIQMSDDGNYAAQFNNTNMTVTLRFRRLATRAVGPALPRGPAGLRGDQR